jgi:hypothetical protein
MATLADPFKVNKVFAGSELRSALSFVFLRSLRFFSCRFSLPGSLEDVKILEKMRIASKV